MAYHIRVLPAAEADLAYLARRGRKSLETLARRSLQRFLRDEPGVEAGHRERMRPNQLGAGWALHLGELRVYYDIDEDAGEVRVLRVGVKPGNTLHLRGQPFDLG
jgi:mRNA-degrading endonuclease RelE of RelBE toxin-antitoxin system